LSFGAVMLIFYVASGWTSAGTFLAQWGRIQWAITVGLAPAVLLLFGQVSVAGPLANAVAIPAVSAVITPLALVAALIPVDALLQLASWLVELLLQFLEWCAALPGALWQQHVPPLWCVLLALGGAARRRAHRAGEPRGGCPGLFASPGSHAERLGGGPAALPRSGLLGVGRRALRVRPPGVPGENDAAQQSKLRAARGK